MGVKRAAGEKKKSFFRVPQHWISKSGSTNKNKGHIEKNGRPPEFRIPEKCKELLDFYAPLKGGVLFLTRW